MGVHTPQDKWLEANGFKLHYLDWGNPDRQPILLLHGFLGHAHVWDDFATEICHDFRVLALDQRGHGQSQWASDGTYSLDDHFSDLNTFIELLALDKPVLMGHSMGGRNALFYTACLPERVDRLILVDARPASKHRSTLALIDILNRYKDSYNTLEDLIKEAREAYPNLTLETCHKIIGHAFRETEDHKYVPLFDFKIKQKLERSNYYLEDLRPFMGNITCPTLVVRGQDSPFVSHSEAKEMCRLIKKSKLTEIPSAGHLPVQENPTAFKKAVSLFLR
ncbi:MAG: alpha/beta hydrolase [Deltaproteobacteria bacterium]|nr:alpha/beta hydrolase [Deltaproteobacteria bacterium]